MVLGALTADPVTWFQATLYTLDVDYAQQPVALARLRDQVLPFKRLWAALRHIPPHQAPPQGQVRLVHYHEAFRLDTQHCAWCRHDLLMARAMIVAVYRP